MTITVVVMRAFNPSESLLSYTEVLANNGISHIIVINDGSNAHTLPVFEALSKTTYCTVLTHEKNRGKGRALKTAFAYILEHFQDITGVVTADADGQHAT